jgi:hypothetical protein
MADEKLIGLGTCPICGSGKARFTFSKKDLACIVCNTCQFQGFARSDNSDMRLRALVKPAAPVADPAPIADPIGAVEKPKADPIGAVEKPKAAAPAWGLFRG